MTEVPPKQDIEELVRRLESSNYSTSDIREAGQILSKAQPPAASYKMAFEFSDSEFQQVRFLGMAMMEAIAPHFDIAKGFVAGAKDAVKLIENGRMTPTETDPNKPNYAAIGDVMKMWLRQSRENKAKGSRR
jgi:hypothetical protein